MHSHNEIEELFKNHLPLHYSTQAIERLSKKGLTVSADVVRNARNGRRVANKTAILAVLVEMAKENKEADEKLNNLINS